MTRGNRLAKLNFEQGYTHAIEMALEREMPGMWSRQFSEIPNSSIYHRSISPVAALEDSDREAVFWTS